MILQHKGGPACTAGPLFISGVRSAGALPARLAAAVRAVLFFTALGFAALGFVAFGPVALGPAPAHAADWIPPRPISAWFPGATIKPGNTATLELVLRAEGSAASVEWDAISSGSFLPTVTPASGALVLQAGAIARIPLSVGVPAASLGLGNVSITVRYANGGSLAAKATASIVAATDGRPEIWPTNPTGSGTAGSGGVAAFTVR
ncbi:MAG TPA: hypothetical protein VI198_03475, partial [Candidatus Eisenbacteria bacterium]